MYEDEHAIAFLDINPLSDGHVLVVPKQQIDSLWALPTEVYQHLWAVAQRIAHAMEAELQPERVGVVVEGLEDVERSIQGKRTAHLTGISLAKLEKLGLYATPWEPAIKDGI